MVLGGHVPGVGWNNWWRINHWHEILWDVAISAEGWIRSRSKFYNMNISFFESQTWRSYTCCVVSMSFIQLSIEFKLQTTELIYEFLLNFKKICFILAYTILTNAVQWTEGWNEQRIMNKINKKNEINSMYPSLERWKE